MYERKSDKAKLSTARLVLGILMLVLCLVVSLQSCMVGLGNTLSGNGEIGGSAGIFSGLLLLVAGVVGVCTRKSFGKGGPITTCVFCWLVTFLTCVGAGSFSDLKLWGFLAFAFGCVYLLAAVRTKKGMVTALIIMAVFGLLMLAMGAASDSDKPSGSASVSAGAQQSNSSASSAGSAEKTDAPAAQAPSAEVTISEQLLLDQSGIRITATGMETTLFGPAVKVLIENSGTKDIIVQTRDVSVNGYMMDPLFSCDVAAGKKANDEITILSASLQAAGITEIADLELSFHILDAGSWSTILDSDPIRLETSAAQGHTYTYDNSGEVIYDQGGIQIVVKGLDESGSFLGPAVSVYLYNGSSEHITVQARDVSANGFMVESVFSAEVAPGKHRMDTITFLSSDLKDNGIEKIEDLELSLHIFNSDNWNTIADSQPVKLHF